MDLLERLRSAASFEDETFEAIDLQGFDFSDKEFVGCTFRNANLSQSVWHRARLEDCAFEGCDLTRFVPADCRTFGVAFRGCKVMGVEWTGTSLAPSLSFEDCNLRYASFVGISLRKTRFVRCKATEVNFLDADLTEADFTGTDLTGATFRGATLAKADLTTAVGAFLDPATSKVKGARVGVETAVLLAASFGMKVSGWDAGAESGAAEERPRRRR